MEKIKSVRLSEIYETINIMLDNGGTVNFNPKGNSMLPLLHNDGDRVILIKSDTLKKNDIALYRRPNGQFVLHRVVKVNKNNTYDFCGDNQSHSENIPTEAIIAKVIKIIRKGKEIDLVNNKMYRAYSFLWTFLLPARKIFNPIKNLRKLFLPTAEEIEIKSEVVAEEIMKFDYKSINPTAEKLIYKALVTYLMKNEPLHRNLKRMQELLNNSTFTNYFAEIVFAVDPNINMKKFFDNCNQRLVVMLLTK